MDSTIDAPEHIGTFLEKGEDGKLRLYRIPKGRKRLKGLTKAALARTDLDFDIAEFDNQVGKGEHVVILGAGVGGLALAYMLLSQTNYRVTVLEALDRVGGRSLTLRPGDTFTEVMEVNGKETAITQKCEFENEEGEPYPPYLNAGPGRIPSGHVNVLNFCKEIGVDLEVYIMETRSNRFYSEKGFEDKGDGDREAVKINRQIFNDTQGHVAAMIYESEKANQGPDGEETPLQKLMFSYGNLSKEEETRGQYLGSSRSGYVRLPEAGMAPEDQDDFLPPIALNDLLNSEFWNYSFYQPLDWLWQATSFQPVGGMDMIEKGFQKAIEELIEQGKPGELKLECPVKRVKRTKSGFKVEFTEGGKKASVSGTQCVSNIPIPLLQGKVDARDFSASYGSALASVFSTPDFLRPTCKVGWQAERNLWQNTKVSDVDPVIPIFGGISYTSDEMTQMWYPSDCFHAHFGVLTGAYNYNDTAAKWGRLTPDFRLKIAQQNAENLHGKVFADNLKHGVSIAWQNIPTQKGGWVDWEKLPEDEQTKAYNELLKEDDGFFIIGDQVSELPGWKEGAVASAINIFAKLSKVRNFVQMQYGRVPSTSILVEGHLAQKPKVRR